MSSQLWTSQYLFRQEHKSPKAPPTSLGWDACDPFTMQYSYPAEISRIDINISDLLREFTVLKIFPSNSHVSLSHSHWLVSFCGQQR